MRKCFNVLMVLLSINLTATGVLKAVDARKEVTPGHFDVTNFNVTT